MSRKSPSVVLVGRPNVGKSTLFNRMTGSRRAIVAPIAGTTRDALARPVVWRGAAFELFGTGGAELMDEIVRGLGARGSELGRTSPDPAPSPQSPVPTAADTETRIAIVGRPNVGKSSLVNRLLREERVLVSDMPGTTRDAIDVPLLWHMRRFRIVDTAGMRRPGRVASGGKVELVSVALAKEAIADADAGV